DVDADGGADLHRRPRRPADRAIRGRAGRRRLGTAALPLSHPADDDVYADGGGDASGDGPAEADRHRLRHDRRRAGPPVGDRQPLQLPGRALLRQDRLWRGDRSRAVRDRDALHACPDQAQAPVMVSRRQRRALGFGIAGWGVAFALVSPFLWMVLGSLKKTVDFLAFPPVFLFTPTLDNYRQVLADNAFLRFTLNSTIVAAGATLIGLLLGIPAAYALARYRRTAIGVVLLMARMAPGIAFLIPLFVMFLQLHLVGSFASLIASHLIFTLPLTVWMMVGFIEAVPIEIEKAALIDGCSLIGVLLRIVVPLTAQGIAATGVLAFIASWNNFLFALVLANDSTKTLPVAVLGYIGYNSIQWGSLMAAATLITLPVLLLALSVQRYIVRGLVAGAVNG